MAQKLEEFVAEVVEVTGSPPPAVLAEGAPVLELAGAGGEVYYVGLIGGKDVGKTSLVNAIAGSRIAEPTGTGEGTRSVIAYAHREIVGAVRRELEPSAGRIEVVTHEESHLQRQVLLDLPDVDSRWGDHVKLTRAMLRHLLYPVWVQSIEKYADARPQELLRQVAEGNDPSNFLFVLNKCDQLIDREGLEAAGELSEDYAERVRRLLGLESDPPVLLVSALRPEQYDMPRLREMLGVQRTAEQVRQSRGLAARRRAASVAQWAAGQGLGQRAESVGRLLEESQEMVADRLGVPVLEQAIPKLEMDASQRMALAEPAVRARLRAWPLVNLIDAAASPLVGLVRRNLAPGSGDQQTVEAYLAEAGRSTARNVQGVFAQLHAANPLLGEIYSARRLWETPEAESAAWDLRRRLTTALEAQRHAIARRLEPRPWWAPLRWLLTLGAALWFLILQPIARVLIDIGRFDVPAMAARLVEVLSGTVLLANAGFVVLYLVVLWGVLRYATYRRVAWLRGRWGAAVESPEEEARSLPAQTVLWMEDLTDPLRRHHRRLSRLARQAEAFVRETSAPGQRAA